MTTPLSTMRRRVAIAVVCAVCIAAVLIEGTSDAHATRVAHESGAGTCLSRPWDSAAYQATTTPTALAAMVLGCLEQEFPSSYQHDEVGLVSLNTESWFQNIDEFGVSSTVQKDMAALGMPPITLEDGPGGLIVKATDPAPTTMPDELALGATFSQQLASLYGTVLGVQAHEMGFDGIQAPDLNLIRVPGDGRSFESFGESPVLAGEMGGAEAAAIEAQHEIPVLKHFGPYSQETDRRELDQTVSERVYNEVYIRPFTLALRDVIPYLDAGDHAVGIMCSYGNVNTEKACRSPELTDELRTLGVTALVRSDLNVKASPTALLLNGVDLIKPMNSKLLSASLRQPGVAAALNEAVERIFETEFAGGLVHGETVARQHPLPRLVSFQGTANAELIEQRAAVLLKDDGILPLSHDPGRIDVLADTTLPNACNSLASDLSGALAAPATCTDYAATSLPTTTLFDGLAVSELGVSRRVTTFTAPVSGPYVVTLTTLGNTTVAFDGTQIINSQGLAEFEVQRTAQVTLTQGTTHTIAVSWKGAPPIVTITREASAVTQAVRGAAGAKVAIVIAYDLAREGMDLSSLDLPGAQNAIISAVAARVPTIVVLATSGPVVMPWLSAVDGVLEVWNPTGWLNVDHALSIYLPAWRNLLDGVADPSGRLPVTFPVAQSRSPMAVPAFWPGIDSTVDLNLPADKGVGIGLAWYRAASWPVLFPFGYGLSYTTYAIEGGSIGDGPTDVTVTVDVRDTGGAAGTESVQVYAEMPAALDEPRQLVGFGTVTFSAAEAAEHATIPVTIQVARDALTTYGADAMQIAPGAYCLEASTYDGDPHSWSRTVEVTAGTAANSVTAALSGATSLDDEPCGS